MKRDLSVHGFKNWLFEIDKDNMSEFFNIEKVDEENPYAKFVGREVKPKVSRNKISQKMECEAENGDELLEDFIQEGGCIASTEGKLLVIEVASGEFKVPRFCVKIRKDQ